jgi:hypothetical protein
MRKLPLWGIIAALIVVILGIIWFFFFRGGVSPTAPNQNNSNPFGNAGNRNRPQSGTNGETSANNNQSSSTPTKPILTKIWDKPVAGMAFVDVPTLTTSTSTNQAGEVITVQNRSTSTYLFFAEKITGNIYKKDLSTSTEKIVRVTNTTIPAVQEAFFLRNGTRVVLQNFNVKNKKLETFVATVPQTISEDSPLPLEQSVFLQDNISSVVPTPTLESFYYLVPNQTGSSLYFYDNNSSFVESFPLKELTVSVGARVFATTKASAFVLGQVFKTQPFSLLYGGKTGLTHLISTDAKTSLFSMWSNRGLFSYVRDIRTGKESALSSPFLSEKCVWSFNSFFLICAGDSSVFIGDQGLPDAWYQGDVSFNDSLFFINAADGLFSVRRLFSIEEEGGEPVDAIKPKLNPEGNLFAFINKRDGSLWLLDLERTLTER